MKKLSIAPISNSAQFFPKKGTLEFLQLAYQEGFAAIVQALIGPAYDPTVVYILRGVVNSGTLPTYTITEGVVFYAGEIFYVDPASFTATGADVGVFSIVQTQYTSFADPVTLSDSTTHNIHNIRKIQLSAGAAGSGIADWDNRFPLSFFIPQQFNPTAPITPAPYTDNILQIIGAYPDLIFYVPAPTNNLHPVLATGNKNLGDVAPGGNVVAITFAAPLATDQYIVTGSFVSAVATSVNDASVMWAIKDRTVNGFTLIYREGIATTQNVSFDWIVIQK